MNQKTSSSLAVPSREFILDQQIGIILASIREVGLWMHKAEEHPSSEANCAAENTFVGLCARLDKIIADETRWDMTGTSNFYDELVETQKAQQEFLSTQTAAAALVLRPSYIHRPTLMRDETHFYAVWGDNTRAGASIIGVGATANAALEDFDAAFDRAPAEQLNLILETETQPEEQRPAEPQDPNA